MRIPPIAAWPDRLPYFVDRMLHEVAVEEIRSCSEVNLGCRSAVFVIPIIAASRCAFFATWRLGERLTQSRIARYLVGLRSKTSLVQYIP
jgi:hypothetical protein